jgi:hypothetical protein
MALQFRLTQLFKITAIVALIACGLGIAREDMQTGAQISLFAFALLLGTLFLRIGPAIWIGLASGFVFGAIIYWSTDVYNETVPADRLFEFVRLTIWCSILTAIPINLAARILTR